MQQALLNNKRPQATYHIGLAVLSAVACIAVRGCCNVRAAPPRDLRQHSQRVVPAWGERRGGELENKELTQAAHLTQRPDPSRKKTAQRITADSFSTNK